MKETAEADKQPDMGPGSGRPEGRGRDRGYRGVAEGERMKPVERLFERNGLPSWDLGPTLSSWSPVLGTIQAGCQTQRGVPMPNKERGSAKHPLSRGLGWFALGLGAVELVAPRRLAKLLGLSSSNQLRTKRRGGGPV